MISAYACGGVVIIGLGVLGVAMHLMRSEARLSALQSANQRLRHKVASLSQRLEITNGSLKQVRMIKEGAEEQWGEQERVLTQENASLQKCFDQLVGNRKVSEDPYDKDGPLPTQV